MPYTLIATIDDRDNSGTTNFYCGTFESREDAEEQIKYLMSNASLSLDAFEMFESALGEPVFFERGSEDDILHVARKSARDEEWRLREEERRLREEEELIISENIKKILQEDELREAQDRLRALQHSLSTDLLDQLVCPRDALSESDLRTVYFLFEDKRACEEELKCKGGTVKKRSLQDDALLLRVVSNWAQPACQLFKPAFREHMKHVFSRAGVPL
jgi:hypothetical protein